MVPKTLAEIAGDSAVVTAVSAKQEITTPTGRKMALRLAALAQGKISCGDFGAEGGSRTHTAFRPQDPKSCAYTSSATSALGVSVMRPA